MGQPLGEPAAATGHDDRVAEALSRLADLEELPVSDHPSVFTYVHERLSDALGDLGDPGH